ncbi:MAG: hypothetical protein Q9221_007723 [Calogaya cf. arnoldii]
MRLIHQSVPNTNIDLDILLFLLHPIDHRALGLSLHHGISWTQNRLDNLGDDWLSRDDDPFYSTVRGKCSVRIDARKTESGKSMMTYKTLLGAFLGLWQALYLDEEEWAVSFRVKVAGRQEMNLEDLDGVFGMVYHQVHYMNVEIALDF